MNLSDGKFLENGGCGYVLKPSVMREGKETNQLDPKRRLNFLVSIICWIGHKIMVHSARGLSCKFFFWGLIVLADALLTFEV